MEIRFTRVLVYVFAIMCYVQTHKSVEAKESDETALHEALLLVELLKTDYARVLRERSQPLSNEIVLDEKDLQTCATRSAVNQPAAKAAGNIIESSNLKPFTPYGYMHSGFKGYNNKAQHNRRLPLAANSFYNEFHKRRFNDRDYYEIYRPPQMYRKMDYENIFGPQPNETNPTSPTTQHITSNTQSSTMTAITVSIPINLTDTSLSTNKLSTSETTTQSLPNTISTPPPLSTIYNPITTTHKTISTTPKPNTSKSTNTITEYKTKGTTVVHTKKLHLNIKDITDINPKTNAPEEAQILAELEQELESDVVHSSNSLTSSSRRWRMTWQPSTRVHLARSTRYPIPLPENHAFCYTNPENPLCRTFI